VRSGAAALAGAALAGLALEIALRLGGAPPAVANPLHCFHQGDPVLGWIGTPGLRRRFVRPAFDAFVEHDEAGFRRPDPPPPAAARERILVLGDSLTWGWGVGQGELFTDWLQRGLAPDVAVVNRGVDAYATSQELLLLERELARGPWSRVLLVFTPGDLEENIDGRRGRRPLFALEDGRLVPRNQPAAPLMGAWRRWWKDSSRAYRWLELVWSRLRMRVARAPGPPDPGAARDPQGLPGAPVTARLLGEMAARAGAAGAAFQVVFVPSDAELGGGPADPLAAAAHAFLRELARRDGIALLDLGPELAASSAGRGLRFASDDHPDARGHRLIAEALLAHLASGGRI
jgi:lysophospholipase L1-like esterase